ncbi:MAG: MFS transporter [Candidatus Levybacteria bacterium]|nr:MFS transporter [Candidatus Levybacteria bacterium]
MKTFYKLLVVALIVTATNNFVWFALTFFAYLETKSVISTGFVGGIYLVATAISAFWFGSLVDHYKKKLVMLLSSFATLILFSIGFLISSLTPENLFTNVGSPILWIFALTLMAGVVSGNIYGIAIPTLVTVLVPEKIRDKANGLFGTVMGISFAITSVGSGFTLAFGGMTAVMAIAVILTITAIGLLMLIKIPEKTIAHVGEMKPKKIDIKGTFKVIRNIPGLLPLILFTTFNNLLGGVFMALMDAYGLSLVNVQTWGTLWGFLSFGFIAGGLLIAKLGLGKNPLKTLFRANIIIWIGCIFFTIQPSIVLLTIGGLLWMILFPFIEATEQTIIQKVVPDERQGRVFGFAQSIEQAGSPLTAFMIGPIAQLLFIPFMTTGRGVDLIGSWFGTGTGRGIALVFIISGLIGLIITILAMKSKSYKLLGKAYQK